MLLFRNRYLKQQERIAKPGTENKDLFMISSEYAVSLSQWNSTVNEWFMRQFALIDIWSTWWDLKKDKRLLGEFVTKTASRKTKLNF